MKESNMLQKEIAKASINWSIKSHEKDWNILDFIASLSGLYLQSLCIFKATLFGIAPQLIRKLWHWLLIGKVYYIVVKFVDSQ